MNLKTIAKSKATWFVFYLVTMVLVIAFIIVGILVLSLPDEDQPREYVRTEYGIWVNDAQLLYLGTPEEMGITWCVVVAFNGSGPIYRYFTTSTDAWAFYSMLRMTYTGGEE